MDRIRVVLVGLGHMGAFHYRVLREDARYQLVAVVDPVLAQLPEGAPAIPLLRSLDQAAGIEFDLALIAAPTEWHDQLVKQALEMGRHVLVEKPAASSYEKARELVALAEEKQLYLAVGHVERCNPVVAALDKVLRSGMLGRLVHATGTRAGGWPRAVKAGNNVIVDLAVHELDVFRMLFGPLQIVYSVGHRTRDPEVIDTAEISLRSVDGLSANVHVNWHTPQRIRNIRVTGTAAIAHLDYLSQSLEIVGHGLQNYADALGFNVSVDAQGLERACFPIVARESLKTQLDHLYAMLHGQEHVLAHGYELIESVALLGEAQRLAQLSGNTSFSIDRSPTQLGSSFVIPNG